MQLKLRILSATLSLVLMTGPIFGAESVSVLSNIEGISTPCQVTQIGLSSTDIQIEIPAIAINTVEIEGTEYKKVELPPGEHLFSAEMAEDGKPDIPAFTTMLAIPDRAGVQLTVTYSGYDTIDDIDLAPVQPSKSDSNPLAEIPFTLDQITYSSDAFYPGELAEADDPVIMRDVRGVQVTLYPVQYNPVRKQLRVYHDLSVSLSEGGPVVNPKTVRHQYLSDGFYPLYKSTFANFEQLFSSTQVQRGGLVIICKPTFADTLKALALWKHKKGYDVKIVRSTEINSNGNPTNVQIFNYLQTAYNTWNVPPEYVMIIGDEDNLTNIGIAQYPYSGYPSDHHYSMVDGSDYLPDLFIGRVSIDNVSELRKAIAKIIKYERTPQMRDPDQWIRGLSIGYLWFESSRLITLWVRELQLRHGFSRVDTVFGSSPDYRIASAINNGLAYLQYRGAGSTDGWWGPSFDTGDFNNLQSNNKLGVWAVLTCGTGDFGGGECLAEYFIRGGHSPDSLKGGPAYYGVSDHNTHTKWNNPIMVGYYFGMFEEGATHFGSAAIRGKLQDYRTFPRYTSRGNLIEQYFNTYNMLGDPELELRTAIPIYIDVDHPDTLPLGVNHVEVHVVTQGEEPVKDAFVTLYRAADSLHEEVYSVGRTDDDGNLRLTFNTREAGPLDLTITGHNLYPHEAQIQVIQGEVAMGLDSVLIDDDHLGRSRGDGDGIAEPGETIELSVALKNYGGSFAADSVTASLETLDGPAYIHDGVRFYGRFSPGETRTADTPYIIQIGSNAHDGDLCGIQQTVTDRNLNSWSSVIEIPVTAPDYQFMSVSIQDGNNRLDPGDTVNMVISILNRGHSPAFGITGSVSTMDDYATILSAGASFGDILADSTGDNFETPVRITVSSEAFKGRVLNLVLDLTTVSGERYSMPFTATVGPVATTDPVGPDAYGYYMYDNVDTAYSPHPPYSWVELVPSMGGQGTRLNFGGETDDKSVMVNLPFNFVYYGESYSSLIVSINGFVSPDTVRIDMGGNYWAYFFNWPIPDPGNAKAQISPFWDDLQFGGSIYGVYTWHDTTEHRYIIEWNHMTHRNTSAVETFEMVIYDPAYYPTLTGDCEFLFQYFDINNTDSQENYASVGIENWDELVGIQYSFDNYYAPGAPTFADGRAIKVTTNTGRGGVRGQVLLDGLDPIEGARVFTSTGQYRLSAQDGSYWIRNIPPANISITAIARGCFPARLDSVDVLVNQTAVTANIALAGCPSPIHLTASDTIFGQVEVAWEAIPDTQVTGYNLYRSHWQYGEYAKMNAAPIQGTAFVDSTLPDSSIYWYAVSAIYTTALGETESFNSQETQGRALGIVSGADDETDQLPQTFSLSQNYPNPFNPTTSISFGLPKASPVRLEVFNLLGQRVRTLVSGTLEAGYRTVSWDGRDESGEAVSSGIYLYKLSADGFQKSHKMLLLK